MTKIISRRAFSKATAASVLAASAVGPFVHTRQARANGQVDVVVIGAGLSGLNAAGILADSGLSVLVLEGSGRIGGRVWSTKETWETNAGAVPIELGASQISGSYARVLDATDRLGLTLIDQDRFVLPFSLHMNGMHIKAEDWADSPANPLQGEEREIAATAFGSAMMAKANPLVELDDWLDPRFSDYDVSVAELLRRNGVSEEGIRFAAVSGLGTELHGVSALRYFQERTRGTLESQFVGPLDEDGEPMEFWPKNILGGTAMLPQAMAAQLGDRVHVNQQVTAIDAEKGAVDVRTLDGSRFRARFVISSLPFTVLRAVSIWPRPPGPQFQAIQKLSYAETTRAFCRIKEPFWQEDGFEPSLNTDGPIRMFWAMDNHTGEGEHRGMFVVTGQAGLQVASRSPQAASDFLIKELERVRPSSKGQIEILRYHSWGNQPLQRGCSPMFAPGQVTAFANEMIVPHGRLHFAGEHTRRLEYGMEAAMESGERAAFEILDRT
ncbi:MAG: FAD-dependent oxidoreductase [Rhodospirillaceae bacterium]|nr:FAD-dependent oxidoreductase [Rhodospirillaceae bacterium]MBT6960223.1 FAD-dependent oxidoreductase [Rhodospirillaceae bacterium]